MKRSYFLSGASSHQRRRAHTPKQIRDYLRGFKGSGQSVAGFARQHGLKYHLLRGWVQGEGRKSARRPHRAPFQALPLSSVLGPAWAAEVVAPNGMMVRLSAQVPASLGLELVALSCRL